MSCSGVNALSEEPATNCLEELGKVLVEVMVELGLEG